MTTPEALVLADTLAAAAAIASASYARHAMLRARRQARADAADADRWRRGVVVVTLPSPDGEAREVIRAELAAIELWNELADADTFARYVGPNVRIEFRSTVPAYLNGGRRS